MPTLAKPISAAKCSASSAEGWRSRAAFKLLKKKLGFRTTMDLIGLDTSVVQGSHGRPPSSAEHGPVWIGPESLARPVDGTIPAYAALAAIAPAD